MIVFLMVFLMRITVLLLFMNCFVLANYLEEPTVDSIKKINLFEEANYTNVGVEPA